MVETLTILSKCLAIGAASRVLFLLLYLIGANIGNIQADPSHDNSLPLFSPKNNHLLMDSATAYGDFKWYKQVATDGYTQEHFTTNKQRNWAFFPLQPALIVAIESPTLRFSAGMVLFALGLTFFSLYCSAYLPRTDVISACTLLCFSPYSASLSQFRPDAALFFSFSLGLWAALQRKAPICAFSSLIAGLAKPNGMLSILLFAPYFIAPSNRSVLQGTILLTGTCGLVGVAVMTLISYTHAEDPLAWSRIQAAWGYDAPLAPLRQILNLTRNPLIVGRSGWDFELMDWVMVLVAIYSCFRLIEGGYRWLLAFSVAYFLMTFLGFGAWAMMKHLAASPILFFGLCVNRAEPVNSGFVFPAFFAVLFGMVGVAMGAGVGAAWL